MRGVIKTKARALVETTYGFEVSGDGAIEENRKKVERLKEGSNFVYRVRSLSYPSLSFSDGTIETRGRWPTKQGPIRKQHHPTCCERRLVRTKVDQPWGSVHRLLLSISQFRTCHHPRIGESFQCQTSEHLTELRLDRELY